MNLLIQVILVIFRNLMILVNMVISGIFIYSCESDRSGDSSAYGHPCDSGAGESSDIGDFGDYGDISESGDFSEYCSSGDSGDYGQFYDFSWFSDPGHF